MLPDARRVITRGAAALSAGGRWVVLDLRVPDHVPGWLTQLAIATVGRFGALEEWVDRRPWEAVQAAMQDTLADVSLTELFFGIAYIAVGVGKDREPDGIPTKDLP